MSNIDIKNKIISSKLLLGFWIVNCKKHALIYDLFSLCFKQFFWKFFIKYKMYTKISILYKNFSIGTHYVGLAILIFKYLMI